MFIADENMRIQTPLARKRDMDCCHFKCDVGKVRTNLIIVRQRDMPSFVCFADGKNNLVQFISFTPRVALCAVRRFSQKSRRADA